MADPDGTVRKRYHPIPNRQNHAFFAARILETSMPDPYAEFDAQLAAQRAARNPSTQPTAAGLSDADMREILDIVFPPAALVPGGQQDFTKQIFAPVMPAISGIAGGIEGGWDGARAGWQAQSEAQDAYAAQNPISSAVANLLFPLSADRGLEYAEKAGAYVSQVFPDLTKAIFFDPAVLTNLDQSASGLANLYDANDWYNLGIAAKQALLPGRQAPSTSQTSAPLPEPSELPRLPGSPLPTASGPPSWVPMLTQPVQELPASAVSLNTPDYLTLGWSYAGPQVNTPVNIDPGVTVSGQYNDGDDETDD
jgi:hypothetical protein